MGLRALQWSGNPYGNGYGLEMDGNGAQFVKRLWIGLDLGKAISLKRYNRYRTFIKHEISNTEARLYPKNTAVIEKYVPKFEASGTSTAYILKVVCHLPTNSHDIFPRIGSHCFHLWTEPQCCPNLK